MGPNATKAAWFPALPGRQSYVDYPLAGAGELPAALLHYPCEAALRVRSHISPGPYRSFRELSLAGPVGSDIWCPPTFVGNSGIERFNGICGFALYFGRLHFWPFRTMDAAPSKADLRAAALAARDALGDKKREA